MFESVHCVLHGDQPVPTGHGRLAHPHWVAAILGCSVPTADALVERGCAVSAACGCIYIHDRDITHELLKAEGGAR